MDDNLVLGAEFSLDTTAARKQIDDLNKMVANIGSSSKSGAPQIISNKDVENAKSIATQVAQAQAQYKMMANAQASFASGAKQSASTFAMLSGEMADQVKLIRSLTTDQAEFNDLLKKEVELRNQATEAAKAITKASSSSNSTGGSGSGSGGGSNPLSQLPGFSQANNLLGGGMSTAAGGVLGVAIGASVAAVKAFGDAVAEAGKKAQELAKGFSDAGGGMDKLRQSQLNQNYADSKLAHNPVVLDMEKAKNDWDAGWKNFVDHALTDIKNTFDELPATGDMNKIAKVRKDREAAQEKAMATPGQLVGANKIQYDQLKRQGVEMEQDIAREKEKLDHDFMVKHRDLQLEEKEERINYDNQVYDNKLQKERETRNFQHDLTKLNADVEFKASNQKYDLERAAEKRNFDLKQNDERQLAAFARHDREQQAQFAAQDRQHQLSTSLSRNAQDMNEDLVKMGISGASSTDYLFKAMDFTKQQSRLIEDSQYEGYKANRSLAYSNFTADRDLQFKQGTERRDFSLGQGDKTKEHAIDLATHQYQLDEARYQLTTQFNDAMQDNAESLRRLTIQQKLTEEKFKNREEDLSFEEKTARRDFDINTSRQRRSLQESKQEFAAQLYASDPYGFDKIEQGNSDLGQDLAGYLQRSGQGGYVNRAQVELENFKKQTHNAPEQKAPLGGNPGDSRYDQVDYYNSPWDGTQAADGLPNVPENKLVLVHQGEAILTVPQANQWRSQQKAGSNGSGTFAGNFKGGDTSLKKVGGWKVASLTDLANQTAGAAYGAAGQSAAASYAAANANAGAAYNVGSGINPAPLGGSGMNVSNPTPLGPSPSQMQNAAAAGGSQNTPAFNPQFNFNIDGGVGDLPPELKKALDDIKKFTDQRMANAKQDAITGSFKLMQRGVFGGG
jgi:hypothetical protein